MSMLLKLWVKYWLYNPNDEIAWLAWMMEKTIIWSFMVDTCKLSGLTMNDYYYFRTRLPTLTMSVKSTKKGMSF